MDNEEDEILDYVVCRTIGKGGFGVVYEVRSRADQSFYALKKETKDQTNRRSSIANEVQAYTDLQGCEEIPKLVDHGIHGGTSFIVLPLLRHSLKDLLESHPRFFTRRSATIIARKLLRAIEFIHSKGWIYRDLKPENVMLSYDNKVYLVDFGMAKPYLMENGEHIPEVGGRKMSGTAWYVSINTHRGIDQSRRDDLESLFYLLILLHRSRLPWMEGDAATPEDRQSKIWEMKETLSAEELCAGIHGGESLVGFIRHVRGLGFAEKPDYQYLTDLLGNVLDGERRDPVLGAGGLEPQTGVSPISFWTKLFHMFRLT